jgi:peptidyl-dipeptidase Dcp
MDASESSAAAAAAAVPCSNPLLERSPLPFEFPQFDKIKDEHFKPAFEAAMEQHRQEIAAIANSAEPPTFDNTLVALERSGVLLSRISRVFSSLTWCNTNDFLQALDVEMSPKLTAHSDGLFLNEKLFQRVQSLHDARDTLVRRAPLLVGSRWGGNWLVLCGCARVCVSVCVSVCVCVCLCVSLALSEPHLSSPLPPR